MMYSVMHRKENRKVSNMRSALNGWKTEDNQLEDNLACVCVCVCVLVTQLCPTLCDLMDYSPPGSSIHGIFQARILEWVAFPSPEDLPDSGIKPRSPTPQTDS